MPKAPARSSKARIRDTPTVLSDQPNKVVSRSLLRSKASGAMLRSFSHSANRPHSLGVSGLGSPLPGLVNHAVNSKTAWLCSLMLISISGTGRRQGNRPNSGASRLPEQGGGDSQGPAGIDDVIDQQDGACGDRVDHGKNAIQVPALVEAVLLQLLRLIVAHLDHRRMERDAKPPGQTRTEVGHQFRVIARWNTGHPRWRRLRLPALANHFGRRFDQLVAELAGVFLVRDHATPAGIAPARQDTAGLGTQIRR
jgi:hypothetical protein